MKPNIHPKLNTIQAACACGASFETTSVNKELRVEICSECHPFYTGKQKFVDSAGRVEKFQKRLTVVEQKKAEMAEVEEKRREKVAAKKTKKKSAGE